MIYNIVNPSDSYTVEASDLAIAAVACILLGSGQYAFKPLENKDAEEVPFFLFGGADEWCQAHFQKDVSGLLADVVDNHAEELAACFDSCLIGGLSARLEYESALRLIESPENREKFRAERHNQRRSSLNDIGGRAYQMAKNIRAKAEQFVIEPALPQVFVGQENQWRNTHEL